MGNVLSQGQEDRKAMQANDNQWAQAAQRRLQNMRDGNNSPGAGMDWLKEKAQDVFARNTESQVVKDGSVITGSNPATKARMLDFEAAQRQANDPKQPMPDLTGKYPAPQE